MIECLGVYCLIYIFASLIELKTARYTLRTSLLWFTLIGWILLLLNNNNAQLEPLTRLLFSCIGTLWLIKLCVRGAMASDERARLTVVDEVLYRFIWPGMSLSPFIRREPPRRGDGDVFVRGYVTFLAGIIFMLILALASIEIDNLLLGLVGLVPFLMIVHLGYAAMLTSLMRLLKFPVQSLFEEPFRSKSLKDFWSRRWNRPFVEMNQRLFFNRLVKKLGRPQAVLLTFMISGLLHELGISYPAGGGWGKPTVYFILHGLCVLLEESRANRFSALPILVRRLWTWGCLILPLPLLFHLEFRSALIVPAYRNLGAFLWSQPLRAYFELLVLLAGLGHFLILIASFQVPGRLGWKEDLANLKPFNRKIMWNYGLFIVMLIVAFGVETLLFRGEMISGDRSALGIAALICGFWTLRILVDIFYFSHSDWPEGPEFVIGHALLNSLFVFLILTYGALLGWHWWLSH